MPSKRDHRSEQPTHILFRRSLKLVLFQLALLYGLYAGLLALFIILAQFLPEQSLSEINLVAGSILVLLALVLGWHTITTILAWRAEYYMIDETSVTHTWGLLHQSSETHTISQNCTIHIEQSLLGMILNYGTIEIRKDGSVHEPITLYSVPRPELHRQYLRRILSSLPAPSADRGQQPPKHLQSHMQQTTDPPPGDIPNPDSQVFTAKSPQDTSKKGVIYSANQDSK